MGAAAQTQIAKATLLTVTAFVQSEDDIVLNRRARALAQPERQALRKATPRMTALGPGCVKTQANTTDRREVEKFYKIEF